MCSMTEIERRWLLAAAQRLAEAIATGRQSAIAAARAALDELRQALQDARDRPIQ